MPPHCGGRELTLTLRYTVQVHRGDNTAVIGHIPVPKSRLPPVLLATVVAQTTPPLPHKPRAFFAPTTTWRRGPHPRTPASEFGWCEKRRDEERERERKRRGGGETAINKRAAAAPASQGNAEARGGGPGTGANEGPRGSLPHRRPVGRSQRRGQTFAADCPERGDTRCVLSLFPTFSLSHHSACAHHRTRGRRMQQLLS